jgi:hypothetical protein
MQESTTDEDDDFDVARFYASNSIALGTRSIDCIDCSSSKDCSHCKHQAEEVTCVSNEKACICDKILVLHLKSALNTIGS